MLRFCVVLSFVFVSSVLKPQMVLAWGRTGHRAIGEIAQRHVSSKTQRQIKKILDRDNLADGSIWADMVRSNPSRNFQSRWHYINVEDGQVYAKPKDETSSKPKENVIWAIDLMVDILRDRASHPKVSKSQALKLLIHFVGDLHQPLHVGRRVDKGGTDLQVVFFSQPYNLHGVWDSGIIEKFELSYTELADHLQRQYQGRVVQQLTPVDWANESIKLRPYVYFFENVYFEGLPPLISHQDLLKKYPNMLKKRKSKKPILNYQYFDRNLPLILERLYEAGVRLARLLNITL